MAPASQGDGLGKKIANSPAPSRAPTSLGSKRCPESFDFLVCQTERLCDMFVVTIGNWTVNPLEAPGAAKLCHWLIRTRGWAANKVHVHDFPF